MPSGSAVALMKAKKRGCELPKGWFRIRSRTARSTSSAGCPVCGSGSSKAEAASPTLPNTGPAARPARCSATSSAARTPSASHFFRVEIELQHA